MCSCVPRCVDWEIVEEARSMYFRYHAAETDGAYWREDFLEDFFLVVAAWRDARAAYMRHLDGGEPVVLVAAA
jgi:hypothetical protein